MEEILCFSNKNIGEDADYCVEEEDIKNNIKVCLNYYMNFLKGKGAIAYENLMEDMATVEICRV